MKQTHVLLSFCHCCGFFENLPAMLQLMTKREVQRIMYVRKLPK
jgi:hypothetical protein